MFVVATDFGLGLHESATPLPPATYRSGKSPSPPSLLARISFQPCLSTPIPLGGSRAPAWPETGYGAGSLGSISACDLGATHGPPLDLRNTLAQAQAAANPASSWAIQGTGQVGDGVWVALGILVLLSCSAL